MVRIKRLSCLAPIVSLTALLIFLSPGFSQDVVGPVVKKLARSKNFDIPPDTDADAAKLIKEGDDLLERRKEHPKEARELTESALKVLKRALPKAPKVAVLRYFLCLAYQGIEKDDLALKEIEEGLKLNPDFYEFLVEKADIMVRKEKYDDALKLYDEAIEKGPNYTYAYEAKAGFMMKQKKFKEALELFKKIRSMEHEEDTEHGIKGFLPILENEVRGPMGDRQVFKAEGDNYIITTDDSQSYADLILKHAEAVYKAYTKVFPKQHITKKEDKFPIMIFSRAEDYHRYGGPVGSGGFFSDALGKVVYIKSNDPNQIANVLYHELFHQFLSRYVDDAPYWFNEGHADFFGGFYYNEQKSQLECRPNPMRFQYIQQALQQNVYTPLSEFLQMDRSEYYGQRIGLNYAQGWAFVYFLWRYQEGKYSNYAKDYFNLIKSKKRYSLKELYQKVFARDVTILESEWRAFVLRGFK
jgi:tetratricopeptide (TPR) repeat protein